ncbi:hypothetical protein VN97_g8722 [Penicillium thymicola]|uniref:DUF7587 domain-containing protein n=1 Tax=Penicillium thymicola TaxID=293382 RepID=A0AAI9X5I5_PENTH|nr:hypothetical protein VN97_g8722 [Penicillium thymicola]
MTRDDKIFLRAWRVETRESMACFNRRTDDILASSSRSVPMNEGCREIVLNHLDWYSESLSPLISVTVDRDWAFHEARRRKMQGMTNVVVHEICISKSRLHKYERRGSRVIYKRISRWLDLAKTKLPEYASYASTNQEFLFLYRIPGIFIVKTFEI